MRLAARVLAAALVLTILIPSGAQASSGFSDVAPDTWYQDPVAWLVENDITIGVEPGCFAPQDWVTRGQIATFLFRLDAASGNSPTGSSHPFDDVHAPYQQTPVAWLYAQGITIGTTPTTFSPNDPITRGQFAAMLWRYAGQPTPTTSHQFKDVVAPWQQAAVSWLAEEQITTGTTNVTFAPNGAMNRSEAAAFMWRFAGSPAPTSDPVADVPCSRELRLALVDAGLTPAEAACSIAYLGGFSVQQLTDVLVGSSYPSTDMIMAISAAATECLTADRVDELTRLLF